MARNWPETPEAAVAGGGGETGHQRPRREWGQGTGLAFLPGVSMATPCVSLSPVEGLKVVEIEKCKSDIKKMREELAARSSR